MNKATIILSSILMSTFIVSGCMKDEQENNSPDYKAYKNITVGNQHNPAGCFINFKTATVYTLKEAFEHQSEIDFVFYHDDPTNSPQVCAPGDVGYFSTYELELEQDPDYGLNHWTEFNNSEVGITEITEGQFEAVSDASSLKLAIDDDYHVITSIMMVEPAKVYKFRTFEGKAGLFFGQKYYRYAQQSR
ncbi:MAG: hypothetical protein KL787_10470 [Taibaiella sp.]|nr:hypothetical protein [Taibaiella sp.]